MAIIACFCGRVFITLWGAPICPECGERIEGLDPTPRIIDQPDPGYGRPECS